MQQRVAMQGQEVSSGTVDPCRGASWHGKCCGKSILSVGRTCLPVVHIRTDIALLRRGADGAWVAMPMPVMTYMCSTIDAVKCKSWTRSLHLYSQLPISTENVLRLEGGSCVLGLQALAHPDATQLAFVIAVDAFVLARSASCPEHVKAWRALCACHYACDCILSRHRRLCPHIVMPYRLAMQHQPCPARIYPAMAWCIVRQLQLKGLLQKGQGDKSEAEAGSQNVRATCRPLRGMTMSRRGKGLQH